MFLMCTQLFGVSTNNLTETCSLKLGGGKEARGLFSVPKPTFYKAGDGRERLLHHWKKYPEPGHLYHQQGFLSDFHLGLLYQTYPKW